MAKNSIGGDLFAVHLFLLNRWGSVIHVSKEYLAVNPMAQNHPEYLFNFDVSETACPWTRICVEPLPPACFDARSAQEIGSLMKVTGKDWALKSGIRDGLWLTVKQLKFILNSLEIPMPVRGSGKSGAVVKIDLAKRLVIGLFPDHENKAELEFMIRSIMGKVAKSMGKDDIGVLSQVAALDPENASAFEDIAKDAMETLATQLLKRGKKQQEEISKKDIEEQVKKQVEIARAADKTKLKSETERNWGLTPPARLTWCWCNR